MSSDQLRMDLDVDSSPVLMFVELFRRALKERDPSGGAHDLPTELCRVESGDRPAQAGALALTLYPSDVLLRYAAALLAGDNVREMALPGDPYGLLRSAGAADLADEELPPFGAPGGE